MFIEAPGIWNSHCTSEAFLWSIIKEWAGPELRVDKSRGRFLTKAQKISCQSELLFSDHRRVTEMRLCDKAQKDYVYKEAGFFFGGDPEEGVLFLYSRSYFIHVLCGDSICFIQMPPFSEKKMM